MNEPERKNRKIYYSMGEVSEMFDVNPSLIRFWEQKFPILKPDKNKKGNRLFTQQDVDNLKLIYHLVKENGMTLAGAQKRLRENREGLERNLEIIERLQGIKAMLLEVRQELKGGPDDVIEILVDTPVPVVTVPSPSPVEEEIFSAADRPAEESPDEKNSFVEKVAEADVRFIPDLVFSPEMPQSPEPEVEPTPASEPVSPSGSPEEPRRMQIVEQTLF